MPEKNTVMFSNREVFWKAVDQVNWKINKALERTTKLPALDGTDSRNVNDLAALLIDVKGDTEEEREAYFNAELDKMIDAFYTIDPATKKPYPENIKPYMEAMYNTAAKTLDIDWNDQKQIENIFASIKASQAFATLAENFRSAAFDLFPTVEDVKRLDAQESLQYVLCNRVRIEMEKAGIDLYERFPNMNASVSNPTMTIMCEIPEALNNAILKGQNNVTIDPTSSELLQKYLLGDKFNVQYIEGGIYDGNDMRTPAQYNDEEYLQAYPDILAKTFGNTTFEQMMISCVRDVSDQKYSEKELVHINGKSMQDIINEKIAEGQSENEAELEAAKEFRNAMTDGNSIVSVMRLSFNKDGQVSFYHQEVNVDLDKLNQLDRQTHYGWFRRALDTIGIWKIPQKYPTNEERNRNQTQFKETSDYSKKLEAAENKLVNFYNSFEIPKESNKRLNSVIPRITKVSNEPTNQPKTEQIVETDNLREQIPEINLGKDEVKIPKEPPKTNEEKVLAHKDLYK